MEKYKIIQIIKERIISERRKHISLDWEEVAAIKIYDSLVKKSVIIDYTNTLSCNGCIYHNTLNDDLCGTCGDYYNNKQYKQYDTIKRR